MTNHFLAKLSRLNGAFLARTIAISCSVFCSIVGVTVVSMVFNASSVHANAPNESVTSTGQLFGFDFELGTQHLSNLVPHLDIDRLESRLRIDPKTWSGVLDIGILDDYITYPGVLESLPDGDLKRSLVQGLTLQNKLLETDIPPPQLILPDHMRAKPTPVPRMTKTDGGILAPNTAKPPAPKPVDPTGGRAFEISGTGLELPKGTDWAVLQRRWKALPQDERAKLITLRRVPARVIADVIETRIPAARKSTSALEVYLRPKPDAPKWMHEVTYSFDGAERTRDPFDDGSPSRSRQRLSVEVALKEPEKSLEAFERTLDEVGKTTGLRTQLEVPQKMKRSNAATHIHFSVEGVEPKRMQTVMEGYRRLQMLRLLDAGDQYDPILEFPVGDRGAMLQNIYDRPIREKHNLVRQVSANRYELKEHAKDVKAELREVLAFVKEDEASALEKMRSEVRQILKRNPKAVDRIKHYNPYILGDFRDVLPQAEIDSAIEARFRQAMQSKDRQVVWAHVGRLLRDESRLEQSWEVIKRVLDENPSDMVWKTINEQIRFSSGRRDHPVFRKYSEYLLDRPDRMDVSGYMSLRTMGLLKAADEKRIVEAVGARLAVGSVEERRNALYSLREIMLGAHGGSSVQSKEVNEAATAMMKSSLGKIADLEPYDRVVAHAILAKIDPSYEVPESIRADARKAMLVPNASVREHALQIAEKLDPASFGIQECGDAAYREHCENIWHRYQRSEATKAMKVYSEDSASGLIRYATEFHGHGSRYLMNYVDIYERPGVLEEVERIIGLGDMNRALRLLGKDGFSGLFRPRSVEVFERLKVAVEKSGDASLKKQFFESAPGYLAAHLKKEGRWTTDIESKIGVEFDKKAEVPIAKSATQTVEPIASTSSSNSSSVAITGSGDCSLLWSKIRRIMGK